MVKSFTRLRSTVLFSALAAYFFVFFVRTSLNVVQPDLQSAFSLSASQFSTLASVYFYTYALMQVPAGALIDYWGPRRSIALAMFIASIGSLLFASSTSYSTLLLGRFISALGVSPVYVAVLKLNSSWFMPIEFVTLTGLTMFIGNLGALVSSAPLALLVSHVGWRFSFFLIGILTLFVSVLVLFFVNDKPSQMGFEDISLSKPLSWKETMEGLRIVSGKRQIWFPTLIYFFSLAPVMTLQAAWGVPMLQHLASMGKVTASYIVMLIAVGFMISALISGILTARIGELKFAKLFLGLNALLWLAVLSAYMWPTWLFVVWFLLIGFTSAGYIPVWQWGKEIAGSNFSGIGMAIVNSGGFLGAAFGQLFYGIVLDLLKWKQFPITAFTMANLMLAFSSMLAFLSLLLYQSALRWKRRG
jgi:MFS family permease